jgi:hypothetical protein
MPTTAARTAKICPSCKTYQDWRRFLVIGQTSLALLVALIAVLTAFIPVLRDALTAKDSNLSFDYQGADEYSFVVLISNTGIRPATRNRWKERVRHGETQRQVT